MKYENAEMEIIRFSGDIYDDVVASSQMGGKTCLLVADEGDSCGDC
ncbi:MAG: hypothetical protein LUG57_04585 [Oscillospiraceae bacterium]|nr:hypothetical protein [Oscillospiraceae bacterium]